MHDNGERFRLTTWVTLCAPSPMRLTLRDRGLLNGDDIPRTTEILSFDETTEILSFDETTESILSFDDDYDEFSRKLQQLSKEWEASSLRASQL